MTMAPELPTDAPALVIAAGTLAEVVVRDLRGLFRWAMPTAAVRPDPTRQLLVVHHTAAPATAPWYVVAEVLELARTVGVSTYGLPYNFVVEPSGSIYYLNDVDSSWPHTYNANWACAIACMGNYHAADPGVPMLESLFRLLEALRTMWAPRFATIEVLGHREVPGTTPTACPGDRLMAALAAWRSGEGR